MFVVTLVENDGWRWGSKKKMKKNVIPRNIRSFSGAIRPY